VTQRGVRFPRSRESRRARLAGVVTWYVHVVGTTIHCVTTVIIEAYSCSLDARAQLFRPPQADTCPCARILRALYLAYLRLQAFHFLHHLVGAKSYSANTVVIPCSTGSVATMTN
jgi:hypothetical protein